MDTYAKYYTFRNFDTKDINFELMSDIIEVSSKVIKNE